MSPLADIFEAEVDLSQSDQELTVLYEETGVSVDRLAYTGAFDELYQQFRSAGHKGSRADVFRRLLLLRKAGLLPRLSSTHAASSED